MYKLYIKSRIPQLPRGRRRHLNVLPDLQAQNPVVRRNRRLSDRFKVDRHHLALLNEQDIFLVHNLSETGFCTSVSERAAQRFHINDLLEVRLKVPTAYLDLSVRVAWKIEQQVGFAIVEIDGASRERIRELMLPLEIASSLQETSSSSENNEIICLQGLHGSDLKVWYGDGDRIKAWQFVVFQVGTIWNSTSGFETITIHDRVDDRLKLDINADFTWNIVRDETMNTLVKDQAINIIHALEHPVSQHIIEAMVSYDA